MARIDQKNNATVRMANWYTRRSYGRDTEIAGVMAHSPPNFRGYGMFEWWHERSHSVDEKLKALAATKAACLIGCQFCLDIGSHVSARPASPRSSCARCTPTARARPSRRSSGSCSSTPRRCARCPVTDLRRAVRAAARALRRGADRRADDRDRDRELPRALQRRARHHAGRLLERGVLRDPGCASPLRRRSAPRRSRPAPTRTPRSARASRRPSAFAAAAGSSNRPNAAGPEPDSCASVAPAVAQQAERAAGLRLEVDGRDLQVVVRLLDVDAVERRPRQVELVRARVDAARSAARPGRRAAPRARARAGRGSTTSPAPLTSAVRGASCEGTSAPRDIARSASSSCAGRFSEAAAARRSTAAASAEPPPSPADDRDVLLDRDPHRRPVPSEAVAKGGQRRGGEVRAPDARANDLVRAPGRRLAAAPRRRA